jgi:hypothetical protein
LSFFLWPLHCLSLDLRLLITALVSSNLIFSGVRVTWSLVLYVCFIDRCLSFCTFSFGHCVVCSSSIDGFWLPPWYFQTLLVLYSIFIVNQLMTYVLLSPTKTINFFKLLNCITSARSISCYPLLLWEYWSLTNRFYLLRYEPSLTLLLFCEARSLVDYYLSFVFFMLAIVSTKHYTETKDRATRTLLK